MDTPTVLIERQDPIARVWLNRPERHNTFNQEMMRELTQALLSLQSDPKVRVVVLGGRGKSFCTGADLNWMREAAKLDSPDNLADAQHLARLFRTLYRCTKPVIARVHGAALGGGCGLVAACDIALAGSSARFALSEVRLGLIPAVISPYVAEAIGMRQARRYCLTAEPISAERALELGLVHALCEEDQLDARIDELAQLLILGGPQALQLTKSQLRSLGAGGPSDDAVLDDSARRIAMVRVGEEAREGLDAFLGKRAPDWTRR